MLRTFALIAALTLVAGCQPAAPAPQISLYALDCGRFSMSDASVFADDGSYDGMAVEAVDPCYLIRHPDGDFLWDAGLPDSLAEAEGGYTSGPFTLRVPTRFVDQLAQLQMTPAGIELFSISHSHFDHVGNAALLTNATWIVDADERAWMFRDEARGDENFALIAPLESFQTRLIEGDADYDVFGDGAVTIIQAPGHTPGHTLLLVRLPNAGPVLLTGDMYHLAQSRERRTVPTFNTDRAQTLASMDKVERIAAETGARIVRQHVTEDFEALPAFPEALS
jgi:glyoxylase-like metal-dependent hydrolase (beta-lactamase superfamily II)